MDRGAAARNPCAGKAPTGRYGMYVSAGREMPLPRVARSRSADQRADGTFAVRAEDLRSHDTRHEGYTSAAEEQRMSGLHNGGNDRNACHQERTDDFEGSKHNSSPAVISPILRLRNRN